jgi:hypothetical protein
MKSLIRGQFSLIGLICTMIPELNPAQGDIKLFEDVVDPKP